MGQAPGWLDSAPSRLLRIAIAATLCLATTMAIFAEPNGDDFCRGKLLPLISSVAGWSTAPDPWSYALDSWHFWTGRWAAMLLETIALTKVDLTRTYPLLLLPVWGTILWGMQSISRAVLAPARDSKIAVSAGFTLWAVFWIAMPGPGDGFYWFTGAVENVFPLGLGMIVLAWTSKVSSASGARKWRIMCLVTIGALITPGFHELVGLSLVAIFVSIGLLCWTGRRRDAWHWFVAATFAVLGSAIVIAAPGNRVRSAYFPEPDILRAVLIAGWQAVRLLPEWMLSVPLLAASLLLVRHPAVAALQPAWVEDCCSGRRKWLLPAMTLLLIGAWMLAPAYAMSSPAPTRTLTGAYLIFLVGWFMTVFVFSRRDVRALPVRSETNSVSSAAALALAGSLLLVGNSREAVTDLVFHARGWQRARQARYTALRSADPNTETVLLPRGPVAPDLFFALDILEDRTGWRNECVAGYFGLRGVALAPVSQADGGEM